MSAARFDELLRRVAPMIQHAASHRAPVSDAERLAVTIRFLAAGISQQALAASYKLGTATVCTIIKEVCQALWAGLKDEVKYPQGAQWEAIRGFTFVDIGAFGRESDAGVFGRTKFGAQLIQGRLPLPPHAPLPGTDVLTPPVFVADEAFPQKINLMRPYPGSQQLSHDQKVYNYRHSQARRVIENAFGILANGNPCQNKPATYPRE
ncbi:hypothetical protein N1851_027339 [Merluccius polli]|uniref:DDE Tnp4 domain-containing protein n=1 Tax=Merluccius polli TaxID=89951 RepID=A0AA47NTH3_MERPO|nr:hypothetical protein N1851_027339 [Merluccius polli]